MNTVPHPDWIGDAVTTAYRRLGDPIRRRDAGSIRATCKLDRMASRPPTHEADAMRALMSRPDTHRAADNELYDRGYANLREALTDAERGATAARPLAGRLLRAARR